MSQGGSACQSGSTYRLIVDFVPERVSSHPLSLGLEVRNVCVVTSKVSLKENIRGCMNWAHHGSLMKTADSVNLAAPNHSKGQLLLNICHYFNTTDIILINVTLSMEWVLCLTGCSQ